MAEPVVLGIDCSTTACKVVAFDARGRPRAEGRAPFPLENPAPDGWEQDAERWWQATLEAISMAVHALGDDCIVTALSVAHQRETFVVTDESGRPLHPALVWMDARCRPEVARLVSEIGAERLHGVSGKPPCTTPSLYKLLYLFERGAPELDKHRARLLDVHAFLVWRLTGRFVTSLASADPLGLVDMRAKDWSQELLAALGLARNQVPELVAPGADLGRVLLDVAQRTGLDPNVTVVAGAGDGQAAGLGAGIVGPGRAYLNLGTAVVSGVASSEYVVDPAFRTMYGCMPNSYFLETDLKGGTFTLNFIAEKLLSQPADAVNRTLSELEARADKLPPGSDGLVLVPYFNAVMNPYWDDDATGIVVGWHGGHGPEHLYRATLEGIALEQKLHTSGVERASQRSIDELVVMGGGARSQLFCSILADAMQKRIVRSQTHEATALGAAMLASVCGGLHADLSSAVTAMTSTGDFFAPGPASEAYRTLYDEVYAGLYPAVRERLRALARFRERFR